MPKERVRLASTKSCRTSPAAGSEQHCRPHSSGALAASADHDADTSSMTSSMSSSTDVMSSDSLQSSGDNGQTNLIVNYLPQSMSQEDMKSLFSSVGDMESCRLIRDKTTGQSLGYGFVKYRSTETANKAIASLNGLRLQNKTIKVSVARPSSDCIKGANLYVGGLPKHVTNQDLINWFTPCGQIVTARVLCDTQSGLTRGVGFVRFNLKSEAETAIRLLSGTVPPGASEPITVKFANQPTVAKTTVPATTATAVLRSPLLLANNQHANALLAQNTRLNQMRLAAITPLDPGLMTSFPASAPPAQCSTTLTVSNLPVEADESAICRLFIPYGGVQSVYMLPGQRTCLVTMLNYAEALNAVASLNGLNLNGCVVQVAALPNSTPGLQVTPGCTNPYPVTMVPFGHSMLADNGRLIPYFLPSAGMPASAGYQLAPMAII